jgi:hypothetical protein
MIMAVLRLSLPPGSLPGVTVEAMTYPLTAEVCATVSGA